MSKGILRSYTPAIAAALTLLAGLCVSCADNSAGSGESGMEHSASQAQTAKNKPEVSAKLVYAHEHERQHGFLVTPRSRSQVKAALSCVSPRWRMAREIYCPVSGVSCQ